MQTKTLEYMQIGLHYLGASSMELVCLCMHCVWNEKGGGCFGDARYYLIGTHALETLLVFVYIHIFTMILTHTKMIDVVICNICIEHLAFN